MLIPKKPFKRNEPTREAKKIFIFCEGLKREYEYFEYFTKIDSRINIRINRLDQHDNNSPLGLFDSAEKFFNATEIEFLEIDEVWFVIDTDQWGEQIKNLRDKCISKGWNVVQSNPCFEVWLYYHFKDDLIDEYDKCTEWKNIVNKLGDGGFDSRKHPIFIEDAIFRSKNNYKESNNSPSVGSTQVYKLAEQIFSLLKEKINTVRTTFKF